MEAACATVKNFFGKQRMKTDAIQAKDGKLLYEQEDIATRWKRYQEIV